MALLRRRGTTPDCREWEIRPSRSEDAAELVAMIDAVAAEGGLIAAMPGEHTELTQSLALAALLHQGGLALTVEMEGRVAGQLTVSRRPRAQERHVADLSIALAAPVRGQGLGRALLEMAAEWAAAVGVERLALSVFDSNARAIAVYRAAGFVEEGVQRRAVRLPDGDRDLVLMALPVPRAR